MVTEKYFIGHATKEKKKESRGKWRISCTSIMKHGELGGGNCEMHNANRKEIKFRWFS
jgi:hypothetical protein